MRLITRNNIRHFFWCQTCTKVHAQTPTERKKKLFCFSIFPFFYFPFLFFFLFSFPYHIRDNQLYFIEQPINYKIIQQDIHIYIQLLVLIIPIIEITILFRSLLPLPSQYRRKFLFKRKQLLYKVFSFSFFPSKLEDNNHNH